MNKNGIPIQDRPTLTIKEAAIFFNIGENKLRSMTDDENCEFVLFVGNKRLIKRKKLEEYLYKQYSV